MSIYTKDSNFTILSIGYDFSFPTHPSCSLTYVTGIHLFLNIYIKYIKINVCNKNNNIITDIK